MNQITFEEGDALLVVDVQKDFCPGGALPIEGGDGVVPVLSRWMGAALVIRKPIYASRDWHPVRHVSFKEEGGEKALQQMKESGAVVT